ncbi:50S ribosomal protein L16 [Candidatus Microgenomates bacterium]|nr:50S ribosomal protein L16 [Candidatus Microgenomates bacterium]
MLLPRKTKYRKVSRGRIHGKAWRGGQVDFGRFGLQSLEAERISSRQIEAARRAITRHIKRGGKIWIRIFPHTPVTAKPNEVGMGKGKGNPEQFVARVKPGTMLFEMDGVTEELAREALRRAGNKLPVRTRFISRTVAGDSQ